MQPPSAKDLRRVDWPIIDSDEVELFHSPRRIGPSLKIGGERLQLRVALTFLLLAAVPGVAGGLTRMGLFAVLMCLSLIAQELGQVLCGLAWSSRVAITLHAFGAHTTIEPRLARGRQFVATLMGPVISVAISLAFAWLLRLFPGCTWLTIAMHINLVWGVVNLLPVLPFAGGRALLTFVGSNRQPAVLLISGALALVMAVEGLVVLRSAPVIFVFGAAAFASLLRWSSRRRIEAELALGLPKQLETARSLLADYPERAGHLATSVAMLSRSNLTANAAWQVVAWAELEQGCPEGALAALHRVRPASDVDPYCLASVEAARGHTHRAIGLLERGRDLRILSVDAIKFLIDLHARLGALDAACKVACAEMMTLDPEDTRRVIQAAFEANAWASATKLADELFAFTGCADDAVSHAYGLVRLGDRATPKRMARN
ncbi:MAG: hypothetical protein WDO69_13890 [Pseudomonadota bacterium]